MPRKVKSKPKVAASNFSSRTPSVVDEKDDDDGSWESYDSDEKEASSTKSIPPWLPSDPPKLNEDDENDTPTDGSHWERVKRLLVRFDTSVANDWKDEIQNQLVVSSLLSAVTTTFVVELQKGSETGASADSSAILLAQILLQLNQSAVLPVITQTAKTLSPIDKAVSSLLYTSLGFSLANITLGLLCLQWIRELKNEAPALSPDRYVNFRHVRYHGFDKGAKGFIAALPLLLLFSLISFFGGLISFVAPKNWVIAVPITIILLSVVVLVIVTTFWPAIMSLVFMLSTHDFRVFNPPYRSVQSWLVLKFFVKLVEWFYSSEDAIIQRRFLEFTESKWDHWYQLDDLWASWCPALCETSLLFPLTLSTGSKEDMDAVYNCFNDEESGFNFDDESSGGGRKLEILRVVTSLGRLYLSPSILGQWETRLIDHLTRLMNSGTPIEDLGDFDVEGDLSLRKANIGSILHLIYALLKHGNLDVSPIPQLWSLLWAAMRSAVLHDQMNDEDIPSVLGSVLDLWMVVIQGENDLGEDAFPQVLLDTVLFVSGDTFTDTDRFTVQTFVGHPVWPVLLEKHSENEVVKRLKETHETHAAEFV